MPLSTGIEFRFANTSAAEIEPSLVVVTVAIVPSVAVAPIWLALAPARMPPKAIVKGPEAFPPTWTVPLP